MKKSLVVLAMVIALAGCASLKFFGSIDTSKLYVGMPSSSISDAGGHPIRVNRTAFEGGVREQWVFETFSKRYVYVYVENNRVVAWQE